MGQTDLTIVNHNDDIIDLSFIQQKDSQRNERKKNMKKNEDGQRENG